MKQKNEKQINEDKQKSKVKNQLNMKWNNLNKFWINNLKKLKINGRTINN